MLWLHIILKSAKNSKGACGFIYHCVGGRHGKQRHVHPVWYLQAYTRGTPWKWQEVSDKSSLRQSALGSLEGLYCQCLNLVSIVPETYECRYTDPPGRETSPSQVTSQ